MRFTQVLIISTMISLFLSCSSSKKSPLPVDPPKPDWVLSRPIDANYYIGVGIANKTLFPISFREEAKRNALNELASEIEVNIKSNSMLFSLEENGELKEDFKSFTKITTNTAIENFEQMGTYESASEYYVFYRLSKAQYQRDKKVKTDKAISESNVLHDAGKGQEEQGNYRKAMQLYIQALMPVGPYLNEQLKTNYEGQEVYWGNVLMQSIGKLSISMKISPVVSTKNAIWGEEFKGTDLGFIMKKGGKAVVNMPVLFTYTEGYIRPRLVNTDNAGYAYAELGKLRSVEPVQSISAQLNLRAIYDDIEGEKDVFIADLVEGLQPPATALNLKVDAPSVHLNVSSLVLGKTKNESALKSSLEDAFTKKGYSVISSKKSADLLVQLDVQTEIQSVNRDRHTAGSTGVLSIQLRSTGTKVYSQRISGVKGIQLSDVSAATKALDKLKENIERRYVPQFHRAYLK